MKRHLWRIRKNVWFYLSLLSTSTLIYMFVKGCSHCPQDRHAVPRSLHIANDTNRTGNDEQENQIPLLTLFTTWSPNDDKHQVRKNTLKNWSRLKPTVRPVFLYSKGTNLTVMKDFGWDVLQISKSASIGLPILKYMFLDVKAKYESMFYGYSNGDILFDHGLVETLLAVANASLIPDKPVMVIGRRTNVPAQNISENLESGALSKLAKKKGRLFFTKAEDYFITDKSYPWENIPELVIGRVAFDNWLVLSSCKEKYNVIEATPTLLAVHQTTQAGNFEGRQKKLPHYNNGVVFKLHQKFNYSSGNTLCAPWVSKPVGDSLKKQVNFLWRKIPDFCYQY